MILLSDARTRLLQQPNLAICLAGQQQGQEFTGGQPSLGWPPTAFLPTFVFVQHRYACYPGQNYTQDTCWRCICIWTVQLDTCPEKVFPTQAYLMEMFKPDNVYLGVCAIAEPSRIATLEKSSFSIYYHIWSILKVINSAENLCLRDRPWSGIVITGPSSQRLHKKILVNHLTQHLFWPPFFDPHFLDPTFLLVLNF